jgi:hypothetical protein
VSIQFTSNLLKPLNSHNEIRSSEIKIHYEHNALVMIFYLLLISAQIGVIKKTGNCNYFKCIARLNSSDPR